MSDEERRCRGILCDYQSLHIWEQGHTPEAEWLGEELQERMLSLTAEEKSRVEKLLKN